MIYKIILWILAFAIKIEVAVIQRLAVLSYLLTRKTIIGKSKVKMPFVNESLSVLLLNHPPQVSLNALLIPHSFLAPELDFSKIDTQSDINFNEANR